MVGRLQRAVGFHDAQARFLGQQCRRGVLEGFAEAIEVPLQDRQTGRLRMTAEAQDQPRGALGHEVKRVAQVKTRNRAARTAQFAAVALRKADRGTVDGVRARARR